MKPFLSKKMGLGLLVGLVVWLFGAATPASVSAHSVLVLSNPQANVDLTSSPAQVELFFSEAVEPGLSSLTVLNTAGQVVDLRDGKVDPDNPTRMVVSLGSLSSGVYTVVWKAVSSTDGHVTSGSFPFAIGTVDSASLSAAGQGSGRAALSPSAVVSQWLFLVALALLAGRFLFSRLVWLPALDAHKINDKLVEFVSSAWAILEHTGLVFLFLALGWGLLVQAGQLQGHEIALPWAAETGQVLLDTRLGLVWLARLVLSLGLTGLIFSRPAAWKGWAGFGVSLALWLMVSLTSHAAADPHPILPVLADWVHLTLFGAWIGGLAYFVASLAALSRDDLSQRVRLTSALILRFSILAIICVTGIGLTGLYAASLRLDSISEVFSTPYGQALLLKLLLILPLLALGAYNLLVLSPRFQRADTADMHILIHFRRIITAEVILGAVVILCASLLSALPPVRVSTTNTDLTGSTHVGDLGLDLAISPGRIGQNSFTLRLTANGQPVNGARQVQLKFTPSQAGRGSAEVQLAGESNGTYTAKGSYLSLPDVWQVQGFVQRTNQPDTYANFTFNLRGSSTARPSSDTTQIAGGLLLASALALLSLLLIVRRRPIQRTILAGLPVTAIAILGLVFLTRPVPVPLADRINPVPPNTGSVDNGKALYSQHCLACHGETGHGDGPIGLTLNPRPVDLSLHAVPGVHTDGQLFDWISNGFPSSRMPPFKAGLSETERWNLVNFIRTLAPKEN